MTTPNASAHPTPKEFELLMENLETSAMTTDNHSPQELQIGTSHGGLV